MATKSKGRLIGQRRALKPKEVWSIRIRLQIAGATRDLALFNLAIDSKLRGCDLVALRVGDIAVGDKVRDRALIVQRKTGRPVQFELTEQTRESASAWIAANTLKGSDFLFPGRGGPATHLSTRQYARVVRRWIVSAGLNPPEYGTPSMRRTKAAQIYRQTRNLRAVQLLLGHTKLESTVRYLGVEAEDALHVSEQVEL